MPKLIKDTVHGDIILSDIALEIINTNQFHKLHHIKQLGCCYLVYPTATGTRFEHSIGVYHLTGKLLRILAERYSNVEFDIPNYGKTKLTPEFIEKMKIAGLMHDIGHGPFSHLFDELIKKKYPHLEHEERSKIILEKILREKTNYTDTDIKFIQSIIDPPKDCVNNSFYQIVASIGIDVDKLDYLKRDARHVGMSVSIDIDRIINEIMIIDNRLAFVESVAYDILTVFSTRHYFHKNVYNHKTIKAIEVMITDIFNLIDPIIDLTESVTDMDKFCQLTDVDLFSILKCKDQKDPRIIEAKKIYNRIITRDLYKIVYQYKGIIPNKEKIIENKNIVITEINIGFVNSNKPNPFDNIYFYSPTKNKLYTKKASDINPLLNDKYFETISFVIVKDNSDVSILLRELSDV